MSSITIKIAETSRSPDVWDIFFLDQLEDEIILLLCFNWYGVHAVLATEITSLQPINTFVGECWNFAAVEIVVAFVVELFGTWDVERDERWDDKVYSSCNQRRKLMQLG